MDKQTDPITVETLGPWSMPHHPEPYMTWTTSEVACVLAFVRRQVAAERKRCAAIAAPEHIPFNDEEWRVRCEIRDAILEA